MYVNFVSWNFTEFNSSKSFLAECLGLSICRKSHLQTKTILPLLFQFGWLYLFIYFLISLVGNSRAMLNRSEESRHSCLLPGIRGKGFNISLLSIMFAVSLPYTAFIVLRCIPTTPNLLSIFIRKECCILSNAFLYLLK